MSNVKWIKLSTDIFNNRKIKQIETMPDGDALVVIWLKLLILAGEVNDGGAVYFTRDIPYTEQLLAVQFNRPLATVQLALKTYQAFGMIDVVDDLIYVSNWERYQNIESLDRIREQTRQRVAKYRENKRLTECNVTVTQCNATEEEKEIEKDKEIDKEVKETKKTRKKAFTPPTLDDVKAYCFERNNTVDPKAFFDYYDAGGWKDKNGDPVRSWKQKVLTWEKYEKPGKTPESRKPSYNMNKAVEKMNTTIPTLRKRG